MRVTDVRFIIGLLVSILLTPVVKCVIKRIKYINATRLAKRVVLIKHYKNKPVVVRKLVKEYGITIIEIQDQENVNNVLERERKIFVKEYLSK